MREAARLIASRAGAKWITRHELGWASVDGVYRDFDKRVARKLPSERASAVYSYEDAALETFRAAAAMSVTRFYELPILHWREMKQILGEEAKRWPEWESTLGATRDSDEKLARKDEELRLADAVVVPSRHVADSLPEFVRGKPVLVAPFGSPAVPEEKQRHGGGDKILRILFAGSMSQRKGLADVFQSLRILKRRDVRLVIMGTPLLPMELYRKWCSDFEFEPGRSHDKVLQLMATCDALVLPSLVEGRALVQQEALACGLPIIVTRNTGGEDLIDEGVTGFLVPIRSPEAIAEKIDWLAEHRKELAEMRRFCALKAAQYSWSGYTNRIIEFIAKQCRGAEACPGTFEAAIP